MRILAIIVALGQLAGPAAGADAPPAPGSNPGAGGPAPGPTRSPKADAKADAAGRELARKVQAFYERTRDLEASFVQTYVYAAAGRSEVSRGTLKVKKPGRMRWDYQEPERKTVAVTGSKLTQWEPEANQVYVDERFDATAMSAAVAFLLGKGDLAKEFALSRGGVDELVLRPLEPDPRVESVTLTVGRGGEVTTTRVADGQGNVNRIELRNIRRNVGLEDDEFEVRVPAGAHRLRAPGR